MHSNTELVDAGSRVAVDVKTLARHAEEFMQLTKSATGEGIEQARQRLGESLHRARDQLLSQESRLVDKGKSAAVAATGYVREYPWTSLASALAVGVIVGLLAGGGDD